MPLESRGSASKYDANWGDYPYELQCPEKVGGVRVFGFPYPEDFMESQCP